MKKDIQESANINPGPSKETFLHYEGISKINLRLAGKNKRAVIAPKRTLSSNNVLLSLNT